MNCFSGLIVIHEHLVKTLGQRAPARFLDRAAE
jgi:hypothetical protein